MKVEKVQLMPNGAQQFLLCHLKERVLPLGNVLALQT